MEQPNQAKILIVSDVDSYSLNCLAEKYVTQTPDIDCIICIGPFHHDNNHDLKVKSPESNAIELSSISSMLATLEQIQCRVIYLPTGQDPITSHQQQLYLTPNSVNIHARKMSLYPDLFISGFTETSSGNNTNNNANANDNNDNSSLLTTLPVEMIENEGDQEDMVGVEVTSGLSSIHMIEELICTNKHDIALSSTGGTASGVSAAGVVAKGIFVLNYRFTHTLNHFLFHMPELLENAGVNVCIVLSVPSTTATTGDNNNNNSTAAASPSASASLHLPKSFGALNIISPVSLRSEKKYTILTVSRQNESSSSSWSFESTQVLEL